TLDMKRGERIGIIGGNGIGKSTFLKTIVDIIKPLGGEYKYDVNVDVGYYDQQMAQYTSEKKVLDDYWDEFPRLTETEARNDLGAFLFSGDDVFKKVNMLSGGERVRLALCKIFKYGPNFLILDEPTNHMDIVGKETLESMLKDFKGSVIFVSHDRYFVKAVATRVLEFKEDGVKEYRFGYSEYEEKRQKEMEEESLSFKPKEKTVSLDTLDKKAASSSNNPGKEKSKLKKKLEKIEEKISVLEEEIEKKKDELLNPEYASMYSKLTEIQTEIDAKEEELLTLMEEWGETDKELSAYE
ncbi:MAG: ABC-F family ATP-binding cassette domain-containing protein, partial [Lachnospiraceae bacterium]|nr:ABC-F family ATP-binding cassette domain-containing protein [Lachnospiraceae bacterium]